MYKVFVNEKPVIFLEKTVDFVPAEGQVLLEFPEKELIAETVDRFAVDQNQLTLFLAGKDKEKLFRKFCTLYVTIEAGGGIVVNKEHRYLFIFRNGKWDLPKGKSEKGEPIFETALREVREETGLVELETQRSVGATFHTYTEGEVKILKKTYWFEMMYTGDKKPVPEISENITHVKWLDKEEVIKIVYKNTFASLKDFMEEYFKV
jgi:8-oxo-dGTP pyrophosphatase MutT (NUDIX family)